MSVSGEAIERVVEQVAEQLAGSGQTDAALLGELEEKWHQADEARRDQERIWKENIAYLEGLQWLASREGGRMLNTMGLRRAGRIRLVVNRLLDHARRLHARLDQVSYLPAVAPTKDDPGAHQAAKAAHAALRWFYRRREFARRKRAALWWLVACGVVYLEAYYDPDAGPVVPVPQTDEHGEIVYAEQGEGAGATGGGEEVEGANATLLVPIASLTTQGERAGTLTRRPVMRPEPIGDVDFAVRSPFQVRRDPRFQEWEKIRYLFVEEWAAKEEVLDRFDADGARDLASKLGEGVKVDTAPWIPDVPQTTEDVTGIPRQLPAATGVVQIKRFYERPSRTHPAGRHVVYSSDVMLHRGDLDTPDADFPLVKLGYRQRPWMLEDASPIEGGKPLQRLFNRIISRFAEHLVRLPAGWLLVPFTSGIPKRGFTSESGAIIRYNPSGGAPQFVFPPFQGLAWYDHFLGRLEGAMEEMMALPPAARGQMPKGARAARTVELLQEAADAIQAPVLNDLADGCAAFFRKALGLMHRHFTVGRLIGFVGADKLAETLEFVGSDLPDDWQDDLAVSVEAGESLPASRMARTELVLRLAREHGLFGPPGSPEYARRLREALSLDAGFVSFEEDLDVTIAENENLVLANGGRSAVRPFDDDAVHLRVHLTFVKRLVASGAEEKAARLIPHIEGHRAQFGHKQGPAGQGPGIRDPGPEGQRPGPQGAGSMRGPGGGPLGSEPQEGPGGTAPAPAG